MTDFTEIYNEYFKDVFRYTYVLCKNESLAEELTQDTFFKALQNIDSFKGECKIRVWLCQIAKNTYFSYLKKQKPLQTQEEFEETQLQSFEQLLIDSDTAFQVHKLLHCLDEPYKEVFTLRLFGELSYSQIADLFGKTESWARVTYHRAQLKLKEKLL